MATIIPFFSSFISAQTLTPISAHKHKHVLHFKRPFAVHSVLTSSTQTSLSPEVENFWTWLCEKGIVSTKSVVRPGIVKEGLGLIAQKNLNRNEVVLEVSKKYWINPDTVKADLDIGRFCGNFKPWVGMALFLIKEKAKKGGSDWGRYIDILPEYTDSTIFWSEEELAELQGTQLLSSTVGVKKYVKSEFAKIEEEILIPHKDIFPTITSADFLWAFGILRSRAFSRLRDQDLVLIPLADLINHDSDITTEEYAWEIKGGGLFSRDLVFSLRSPVSIKAGEQVFIQYDLGKSNAEFALDYGFIESKLDRNIYTLTLGIPESDPFYGDKLDIAESNGLGETAYFDFVLGQSLPSKMLPYLRLIALGGTDAFLLESIFSNSVWGFLELPISQPNEELICRVVRDACKSALSGYKTTVEEDEKLLEGGNVLDTRLTIAIGIRIGEKKVLKQIDSIFKDRELELDELEYYQERRLKDLGLAGEQGDIIFWEPK